MTAETDTLTYICAAFMAVIGVVLWVWAYLTE